ncbi:MAG: LacI family DNA-binding transcriptional regulator [Anaerorhabdus sp.]
MKVKLKDIAEMANVSIASVSMVLNNPEKSRVSEEKQKEILEIAKRLNYRPNLYARSLVTKETLSIGFVVPDITNPFFARLAKVIEIKLREKGYVVNIINTNENYENDIKAIEYLYGRGVDGLIIALSGDSFQNEDKIIKSLSDIDIPYILVDRVLDSFDSHQVIFNNKRGGFIATNYLINKGHTRIAHISTAKTSLNGLYRHKGYLKALRVNNIKYEKKYVCNGTFDFETGEKAFDKLPLDEITAVFCANDLIAYGFIKKCNEAGIKIPEDISVIGYDNLEINDMFGLGLTSINQNIEELGNQASIKLFKALNCSEDPERCILDPNICERNSVSTLKRK